MPRLTGSPQKSTKAPQTFPNSTNNFMSKEHLHDWFKPYHRESVDEWGGAFRPEWEISDFKELGIPRESHHPQREGPAVSRYFVEKAQKSRELVRIIKKLKEEHEGDGESGLHTWKFDGSYAAGDEKGSLTIRSFEKSTIDNFIITGEGLQILLTHVKTSESNRYAMVGSAPENIAEIISTLQPEVKPAGDGEVKKA